MTIVCSTSQAEPHLGFYVWGGGGGSGEEGANSAHPSQGSHVYRQGLNWTFCFDSYTESCLQDLLRKKKKHALMLFVLHVKLQKLIIIFIRKLVLAFASKDFPKQLFGIHIKGMFCS